MMPYDFLHPEQANDEAQVLHVHGSPLFEDGSYFLREYYCNVRGCDCRRAVIKVMWQERREVVATIGCFLPAAELPEGADRFSLDPDNEQTPASPVWLEALRQLVESDPGYLEQLERHYASFKEAVEDPAHPDHQRIARGSFADGPRTPVRRAGPKVGANDPCPCGSGRKHKRCCMN